MRSLPPATRPPLHTLIAICVASFIAILFLIGAFFSPEQYSIQPVSSKFTSAMLAPIAPTSSPLPIVSPIVNSRPYPPAGYHCVNLPILMYHHVEPLEIAKEEGHAQLTVDSKIFATQMQYLVDHGYTPILLSDLAAYFDAAQSLPEKPVILTFDDAYSDFHDYAVPILSAHGFVSDLFVPTGLIENPGYLSWTHIKDDSSHGVSIDHHTWSHANVAVTNDAFFHRELDIATQQLIDHGYGPVKIFAYPYGTHNGRDVTELAKRGFTIAVTTLSGQIQCKEDRLQLHRTRIGNSGLKSYGL